jgi:hypothetical protein
VETAAAALKRKSAVTDPKAQEAFEKQIADFKATVERYEKDPKKPEDSLMRSGPRQGGLGISGIGQSPARTL